MSSLKKFRPRYWRSLNELEQTPEFREFVEREFAAPLEHAPPNSPARRRFLELMGASFALAGCRWQEDKLVPLTRRPEGVTPGVPRRFATAMEIDGVAVGLHVTSYDGRPIKVDGNPMHPESLGACYAHHQASVLGMYDPDRSDSVRRQGTPSSWDRFQAFARPHFTGLRAGGGAGLVVVAERSSSPTLADLKQRLLGLYPSARWVTYEPAASAEPSRGSELAFGRRFRTHYAFDRAAVILSLDADFVGPHFPAGLANARGFSRTRVAESGEMSRLYVIESGYSHAGAQADHRLPLRAELIKAVAAYLDAELTAKAGPAPELGPPQTKPNSAVLADPALLKFLDAVVKDLAASLGRAIVVVGPSQPPEVHAIGHRLNALLGSAGRVVFYTEDADAPDAHDAAALKTLVEGAPADTLLVIGGNPVFTAPVDVPFAEFLKKAKTSIHLSLYEDETSALSTWHVPRAHYLESWGDARAYDGTLTLQQPLIQPLYGGKSAIELLAFLIGDEKSDGLALVKRTHAARLGNDRAFRRAVHDGVVDGSAQPRVAPKVKPLAPLAFSERELAGPKLENGKYELAFQPDDRMFDGRFTNNGWLQELAGSFTKVAWDNAVLVPMSVAEELGLTDGYLVDLTLGGRSIRLPAVVVPGQADGTLRVTLGYGRTHAGHVGGLVSAGVAPVGANAYAIRTLDGYLRAGGATLTPRGAPAERLASQQDLYAIDQLGREGIEDRVGEIVREGTIAEYAKNPKFAKEKVHHPPLLNLWVPPVSYEGHRWGMSIDLNKCIGCNACVTACQAENNIPVTGKEAVAMGREMLWLRVDRYYKGDPKTAELAFQPLPCQQCENAPCEQVCPVGATMHSSEGLNDMVYNRCIGTRYCSNNCPYKVRRFNYFNYNLDVIGITPYTPTEDPKMKVKAMVFNPDVTVRSRGVMEKCTFCVQRIQNGKIRAKNAKRALPDGEVKTACQETCPTEAIVFGDLNDGASKVAELQRRARSYEVLGELNNKPRVQYLARIKNPNPELA